MKRWFVIAGAVACALASHAASAKQSGPLARSNEVTDQVRMGFSGAFGPANGRLPATALGSSIDVVAGPTFVGRDPDRNIRFQILRDSKF